MDKKVQVYFTLYSFGNTMSGTLNIVCLDEWSIKFNETTIRGYHNEINYVRQKEKD